MYRLWVGDAEVTLTNAIQTMYAGTLFRSRLEARWAVFFDTLGIKWEFEPEGFYVGGCRCEMGDDCQEDDCTNRARYLPDFYLPNTETWVEVKGSEEHLNRNLLCAAADYGTGLPGMHDSDGSDRGILILGSIPRPELQTRYLHPLIQHRKGVWVTWIEFSGRVELNHFSRTPNWQEWFGDGYAGCDFKGDLLDPVAVSYPPHSSSSPAVNAAYSAARSARFEHDRREVWAR